VDALQDYFDFVMQYAPYFYYIPGSGVDPEWGRGPAAAAHAIDFLHECYNSPSFEAEKTNIKNKIVELADFLLSQQHRTFSFGYETKGANYTLCPDIFVCKYQCPKDTKAISIVVYLGPGTATRYVKCAIYDSSFNFIAETEERYFEGYDGWYTFSFSERPSLTQETDYWLAVWASGATKVWFDFGDTNQQGSQPETYDGWPATLSPYFFDYKVSIYCNCEDTTKYAYGGFKSREDSDFYYSIDAHRAIPALLKAYDLTGTTAYLDAAKLAGGNFLYTMQQKPSEIGEHDKYYGGFAQWVDVNDDWGPDMWVVDLYGLIGLKELYTRTEETKYQTMITDSLEFYREGFKDLWLYYMPPPSGDGAWHRAPGVPPENLIYDDDFSYALHALYLYEGWSETVEKVFRYCSEITQTIDYPAYQPAVCWPGYLDVVNRKPDCEYYDAVTSGILALKLRKQHDRVSYEYAKKIVELHSDAFMFWGPRFSDYTPVENKKSVVTVSWLGLYLLEYSPVSNKFTQILNAYGENITYYSVIPGETESYAEGVQIKAVVRPTRSGEVFLEPGYVIDDYVTVYVFSPLKHHDKLVFKSIAFQVIGVQEFRFEGDVMYVKAFCRRLIT
jgi:hypothetical protein